MADLGCKTLTGHKMVRLRIFEAFKHKELNLSPKYIAGFISAAFPPPHTQCYLSNSNMSSFFTPKLRLDELNV